MDKVIDKPDNKVTAGALLAIAAMRAFSYYRHGFTHDALFVGGFVLMALSSYMGLLGGSLGKPATTRDKLFAVSGYAGIALVLLGLIFWFTQ